jgi:hypothetical protein
MKFLLEDSSSLDDSDIENLIFDEAEDIILMRLIEIREEAIEEEKRKHAGSQVGSLCLPRNQALGHEMLIKDYSAEVCTYPDHLFRYYGTSLGDLFRRNLCHTAKVCYLILFV